jgi:predicted AAA+ superfamily ATPase
VSETVNENNMFLRKRLNELAAMFKEEKRGTRSSFKKIKSKFCLQEGVSPRTADQYVSTLEGAGLLIVFPGNKRWRYNSKEEWDLFRVTPIFEGRRRR